MAVLEPPEYASDYEPLTCLSAVAKCGAAVTSHGAVAFILWTLSGDALSPVTHEHFLNPHAPEMLELLQDLAAQSHLKFVIVNSVTSNVVNWFEIRNTFGFEKLICCIAELAASVAGGDFELAQQEFLRTHDLDELMRA